MKINQKKINKMNKINKMFGGIVKKNPDDKNNNFVSVLKMLNNPRCKLSHVSYRSLKGFIFKLHLEHDDENPLTDDDIEFYGLNETKTGFNAPIEALVIKMAILHNPMETKNGKEFALDDYTPTVGKESYKKETDTYDNFQKEAVTQSEIYEKTVVMGDPICPALVDFSFFTEKDLTYKFIEICLNKSTDDVEATNMLNCIKEAINKTDDTVLGMITMESAVEYGTFYDIFSRQESDEDKYQLTEALMVAVIRLFNETSIVHCDLHWNNSLVKENEDGSFKVYLIDFGRIMKLDEIIENQDEIYELKAIYNQIHNKQMYRRLDTYKIREFSADDVFDYIDTITAIEKLHNNEIYGVDHENLNHYTYYNILSKNTYYNSFRFIAESLNTYYNLGKLSGYKRIKNGVGRTYADLQKVFTHIEEPKRVDERGSPTREAIVQQRNAALDVIDDRNRKRRFEGKESEQMRMPMPMLIGMDEQSSESSESTSEGQDKFQKLNFSDSDGSMEIQEEGHPLQANLFGSDFSTPRGGKKQRRVTKKARRNGKKSQKTHRPQSLTQSRIKSLIKRRTIKHNY